jgi:hypothetical protein
MLAIIKVFFRSDDSPEVKKLKDDIIDRRASLHNKYF